MRLYVSSDDATLLTDMSFNPSKPSDNFMHQKILHTEDFTYGRSTYCIDVLFMDVRTLSG